jgi:hypothetical protein
MLENERGETTEGAGKGVAENSMQLEGETVRRKKCRRILLWGGVVVAAVVVIGGIAIIVHHKRSSFSEAMDVRLKDVVASALRESVNEANFDADMAHRPVDVAQFSRRLPDGWSPSPEAIDRANAAGIALGEGETFVRQHQRMIRAA